MDELANPFLDQTKELVTIDSQHVMPTECGGKSEANSKSTRYQVSNVHRGTISEKRDIKRSLRRNHQDKKRQEQRFHGIHLRFSANRSVRIHPRTGTKSRNRRVTVLGFPTLYFQPDQRRGHTGVIQARQSEISSSTVFIWKT